MRLRILFLFSSLMILCSINLKAQNENPIYLTNPSFEDMPRNSQAPIGWFDCGFAGETPPDVQPAGKQGFEVTKSAVDGYTYLGMVVRDNDTWEAVGQRLSRPLERNKCYEFSINLSRSTLYISLSKMTQDTVNYIQPIKLRVYGGYDICDRSFLLAESELIEHFEWREYSFKFEPVGNYSHIVLEAFYQTPTLFPYNGNILIDRASEIVPIPCDEDLPEETEEVVAEEEIKPDPIVVPPKPPVQETPNQPEVAEVSPDNPDTSGEVTPNVPKKEEVKIGNITRKDLKAGTTIKIDKLYFAVDKSEISDNSRSTLEEVYRFLDINDDLIVEIGGHTNGLPPHDYCDELSTARAKAVADYLANKGISKNRLTFKGYGKRNPIASNKTESGRKRNQRVEIKILEIKG